MVATAKLQCIITHQVLDNNKFTENLVGGCGSSRAAGTPEIQAANGSVQCRLCNGLSSNGPLGFNFVVTLTDCSPLMAKFI